MTVTSEAEQNPHIAKTLSDLLTPAQLVAIRAITNSQGKNADTLCREELGCLPIELSRSAASEFIDSLKQPKDESREIEQVQLLVSGALKTLPDQSMAQVIRRLVFQPQVDWSKGVDAVKLYCPEVKLGDEAKAS